MSGTVSFWQFRAGWSPPHGAPWDVAVVGGGIAGVSVAWWVRRFAPEARVVVLERERLAAGATGRNAGFVLPGTHTDYASAVDALGREPARRLWAMTEANRHWLRQAVEPAAVGWEDSGALVAAGTPAEAERLERSYALLTEDGVPAELRPDAGPAARGFLGALHLPKAAVVDPVRLVRHLAAQSGAALREAWPVAGVESAPGGCRVLGDADVTARHVVLATNAYLPQLRPELARAVRPVRAQMLATAPLPRRLEGPVYSHEGYFYVRQIEDGRVLLGGARHLHREEEVGYEDRPTDALQRDLEAYLARHFPWAAGAPVEGRWSGTMGFAPDERPAIGAVDGVPGAWWLGGFTGHGMGYAFATARALVARMLGERDPASEAYAALLSDERRTAAAT